MNVTTTTGVTTGAAGQDDEEIDDADLQLDEAEGEEAPPDKTIPYKRFVKLNEKLKLTTGELEEIKAEFGTLAKFRDFINDLKADGIDDSEGVRAFIAKQNTQSFAATRDQALNKAASDYHAAIADGATHAEAIGAYNVAKERAELRYDKQILEMEKAEVKRQSAGSVAARVKAATDKYPEADPDVLRDLALVPGVDLMAKAKTLHDKEIARQVNYSTKKTKQGESKGSPTAAGKNAAARTTEAPPNPLKDPKAAQKWLDEQVAKSRK